MSHQEPPARVRVTAPRTVSGKRRTPRTAAPDIDARTEIGEIFVRSLVRAQLRTAAGTLVVLAVVVGGLPLAFRLWPRLAARQVAGMPLAWCLLAFFLYPVLVVLAWWHVRRAERVERAFTDVVEGS